jgi:hypothetical protein
MRSGGSEAQGGSPLLGARQRRLLGPDHRGAARFLGVYLNPHQFVFRKIRAFADSVNRASWNTCRAIDAGYRINVHALIVAMETRHRTGQNAICESTTVTVPGNHVGHGRSSFERRLAVDQPPVAAMIRKIFSGFSLNSWRSGFSIIAERRASTISSSRAPRRNSGPNAICSR